MNSTMNSKMIPTRLASLLGIGLLSAVLVACGGGGGGSSAAAPAAPVNTLPSGTNGGNVAVLPVGTGTVSFSFGTSGGEFVKINGGTGAVTALSTPCSTNADGFISADLRPDGSIVALLGGATPDIYLVDALTGNCRRIGTAPAAITAIAVRADNTVWAVSTNKVGGQYILYQLDSTGSTMLQQFAMVWSVADPGYYKGLDFAPDGKLYVTGWEQVAEYRAWEVDQTTGALTMKFAMANPAGDIDIDSTGVLRSGSITQSILAYDVNTGAVISNLPIDRAIEKFLVYR